MIGCAKTFSQEIKDTKESQEIIIKKKGDKDAKLTLEIKGTAIFINGKPLVEFKEDGITINNRKMIIRDGDKITMLLDDMQMPMLETIEGLSEINMHSDRFGNEDGFNINEIKGLVLGVMTEPKGNKGVVINKVIKESPASKIGLQKEDIIYKVDEAKITTPKELADYILTKKEGDKIKVYFTRAGKKMDATATLEIREREIKVIKRGMNNGMMDDMEMQNDNKGMKVFRYKNDAVENAIELRKNYSPFGPKLGIKIQDTETENGVKVLDVEKESLSATAGLQKDDIIIAIADKNINNTDEAREALSDNKTKPNYTIKVKRNGKEELLTVKVPKKLKVANL